MACSEELPSCERGSSKKPRHYHPSQCPICYKVFIHGNLNTHIRGVHKETYNNDPELRTKMKEHAPFRVQVLPSKPSDEEETEEQEEKKENEEEEEEVDWLSSKTLEEVLEYIKAPLELLPWPLRRVSEIKNIRSLSEPELQLYGAEPIDRPRIIDDTTIRDALPSMERLIITTATRYAGMPDERQELGGRFKEFSNETRALDPVRVTNLLSSILTEDFVPSKSPCMFDLNADETGEVSDYVDAARNWVKKEYGNKHDALDVQNTYSVTPKYTHFHVHHDRVPSLATVKASIHRPRDLAKLWLFWPRSLVSELYDPVLEGSNMTIELLKYRPLPAFLMQRADETVMVPPYTPYSMLTIRSCVLFRQAFRCARAIWLPDICADISEPRKSSGRSIEDLQEDIINKVGEVILGQKSPAELASAVKWLRKEAYKTDHFLSRNGRSASVKYYELWARAINEHKYCFICHYEHNKKLLIENLEDSVAHAKGHIRNRSDMGLATTAIRKVKPQTQRRKRYSASATPDNRGLMLAKGWAIGTIPRGDAKDHPQSFTDGETPVTIGASDNVTSYNEAVQKQYTTIKPNKLATPGVAGLLSRAVRQEDR